MPLDIDSYKRALSLQFAEMPSAAPSIAVDFGREDPRDFICEVLGEQPTEAARKHGYKKPFTPDQEKVLLAVRDHRRVAVPSGHATGKTAISARAALWWLYRRKNSIVVTSAPTERQVKNLLWGEIRKAFRNSKTPLPGDLLRMELRLDEDWYAIGVTATPHTGDISATTFQGFHGAAMMAILDEATGVTDEIWEGVEGICVGEDDRILAIANPTDPASRFKRACDNWHRVHLDSRNHPNVKHGDPKIIPGAATSFWVADRLAEYGSEDSPLFKSKVTGEFPDQSSDSLISVAWVTKAQLAWTKPDKSDDRGTALGVDVAGEGEDLTVLWACRNGRLWIPKVNGKYAWHVGREVLACADLVEAAAKELPDVRSIAIDDTAIGSAVTSALRRKQAKNELPRWRAGKVTSMAGRQIRLLGRNFGATAINNEKFANIKSELWWRAREALRDGLLKLPPDAELGRYALPKGSSLETQLTAPIYDSTARGGRIEVFDKRLSTASSSSGRTLKTRNLPIKSPDVAHGLILAVDAWTFMQPHKAPKQAKTTMELFEAQTREMIERTQRRSKGSRGRAMPWQRRRG